MELIRGLLDASTRAGVRLGGCAVAIGNFDGVHLGHQALVRAARAKAREFGLPSAVLTFEPLPREFFDRDAAPPRLMRLTEKCEALAALELDRLVVARFDARLQRLRAPEFVAQVLANALGARHVVVGEGFRFAVHREGTVETLREGGVRHGFTVESVPAVVVDGERVSSTRVRAALAHGNLALVRRLLGRDYRLSGRVIRGQQLGRRLGYATANLRLHRRRLPLSGIYAVRVAGIEGAPRDGVASLGTRPTVNGVEPLLETHVFDFAGDLYGRRLHVDFVAKIRDEARFETLDALVAQMHDDADRARRILAARAA
ncbi:MAG: bifunctional riboflavin kinase/FAD synthetase [Steroidobacteraceae bacterium]|jgi:riboflavin kinase/FMN adenylyltransferase|nr:bifunctional riboflavin kinase/FAD synthetase [Steroidobacteraceae bacterium]